MTAVRVLTREEVEEHLRSLGFQPTGQRTASGEFWRRADGKHVQVPFPYEGMYPDFLIRELVEKIGKIPTRPLQ